jgi:hypothetical protein
MIDKDKIKQFARMQTSINIKKIQTHFNCGYVEAKEIESIIKKMEGS